MTKISKRYESMYVAVDTEDYPIFATVSLDAKTAKERLIKIGPSKSWDYYAVRYKIKKVTIEITEE